MAFFFTLSARYEGAEPLFRGVLAICEEALGKDHPDTATSLNSLAGLLYRKGDYAGAEPLFRRALAIREKALGQEHPDTATSINNLALLLDSKGDYAGAEPLLRRALAIREKVLGKEHPDTATSINSLADLLQATNRLAEAEPLSRRMVEIFLRFTRETGHPHPRLHAAANNYAGLLEAMGRSEDEIRVELEKLSQRFGVDLGGAGGQTNAEPLLKLRTVIEQLMRDPSNAQDIAAKLQREDPALFEELIQFIQQQEQQKQQIDHKELAIMEKTLGQEHPDTITARYNLAQLLGDKGDHKGSASLYRQLIATYEELLKKNVPILSHILEKIASSNTNLAFNTLVPERNWKEAESHYQKAVDLYTTVNKPIPAANAELNLQTMFHLSGQQVDIERVKALTHILEEAKDKRAEKGHRILKEISDKK